MCGGLLLLVVFLFDVSYCCECVDMYESCLSACRIMSYIFGSSYCCTAAVSSVDYLRGAQR